MQKILPNLRVLGGCCGTDHRHVEAICTAFVKTSDQVAGLLNLRRSQVA
ncbi:MAG: hypothetical protein ACFBSF_21590 [Leptolyngbyaceae cyanobacterium]